jgi:hypothetical protein
MAFYDLLNKQLKESQEYLFLSYQKYLPLQFNSLYTVSSSLLKDKKLSYPHAHFDVGKLDFLDLIIS